MTPAIITRARRWRHRQDAQERYFDLDRQAGKLMSRLAREDVPAARAALLGELAAAEQSMADLHMDAFGPVPLGHEGGRDMAGSLAGSARLVRFIAGAEHMLAHEHRPEGFMDEFMALTEVQQQVLTGLFHTRDRDTRADMIDTFYAVTVDTYGGQAAETLVSLAGCEREAASRRRCAACGHPGRPGDPLRRYRLQRVYPRTGRHRFEFPRYELLWSHRSHNLRGTDE